MWEILISDNVGCYLPSILTTIGRKKFPEGYIGLSLYRRGKRRRKARVESYIEKTLEHELIHLVIAHLESEEASWLFDIVEYQTFIIWDDAEIPNLFLSSKKHFKTYRERKARNLRRIIKKKLSREQKIILENYRALHLRSIKCEGK